MNTNSPVSYTAAILYVVGMMKTKFDLLITGQFSVLFLPNWYHSEDLLSQTQNNLKVNIL